MKLTHKNLVRIGGTLLLAVSAALTAKADYQSTVLSQNPSGYYRLNETVPPQPNGGATNSGSLGASANGTFVSLPTLNAPGPFSGSVSVGLDGTSQYINTPWVAGLNTASFSFEVWAKPTSAPFFAYLASSVEVGDPRSGWYLAQDDGSTFGHGSAWVVRTFNQHSTTPAGEVFAPVSAAGAWVHLVVTYDGSVLKMYTNGVIASTAAPTNYVPNVDAPFTVGARSSLNFFWPGNVAEAAMYSSALSATRVAAHYTAGTTAPSTYAATVLADAPLVYDRYQAPPNSPAGNLGTLGSAGNGLYLAPAQAGSPGPVPPTFPGFDAVNKAASFTAQGGAVRLPPFNFNTNTITISAWINATNLQNSGAGLVVCDSGTTGAGLIIDGLVGGYGIGYYWNNQANTYNWSPTSLYGLATLPDSDFAYVALVIQPTEADIYIAYTNSLGAVSFQSATNKVAHVIQAFAGPTLVGTDAGDPDFSFNGAIDEVAIWNRSLSSGELYSQYASAVGGLPPVVFTDPQSPDQPIIVGDTLTLAVNAGGTPNLSYQWFLNYVAISGATNSVYSKPNFSIAADSGSYYVTVTNLFGSVTSGSAAVTGQLPTVPVVISGPVSQTLYPGGTLNLRVVASGGGLHYQWKTNGISIPGATSAAYIVLSVTNRDAGTYTVSVTNVLGATNLVRRSSPFCQCPRTAGKRITGNETRGLVAFG